MDKQKFFILKSIWVYTAEDMKEGFVALKSIIFTRIKSLTFHSGLSNSYSDIL